MKKKFDSGSSKRPENTYQFCSGELQKFCLTLRQEGINQKEEMLRQPNNGEHHKCRLRTC